ncbi:hypothetical protein ABZV67_31290 [Streptomyces sp. NPDC005065]|uniref:hypothetical protein n=1 Tax=unclassified Streptomyces TaxID=2593676 RepID=UPI0033B82750
MAQTLLIAAIICIANLRAIENFPRNSTLTARRKTELHSKQEVLPNPLPDPAAPAAAAPPPLE